MSENIDDATQLSDTTRLSDSTQLSDATHLASAPHTGTNPSTASVPQPVALPNLPQWPSQASSEKPSPTTDAASIPAGDDSTPQSQPQRQSSKAAQAAASALPASINSGLLSQPTAQVRDFQQSFNALVENVSKVVIGKTIPIKQCITALMVGGHILLEDNPGTGKTQLARGLANSISTGFKRIQFTPDLLPSDVVGVTFYDQKRGEFESHRRHFRKPGLDAGFPCFSNGSRMVCNSLQITSNHCNYRKDVGKMWARNQRCMCCRT